MCTQCHGDESLEASIPFHALLSRYFGFSFVTSFFGSFLSVTAQSYKSYKGAGVRGLTAYNYNLWHALFFFLLVDL